MEQPEGFAVPPDSGEKLVCKLNKSLYGLKQSARNWNKELQSCLLENGFIQSLVDQCVYVKQTESGTMVILIWVDDLIVGASNEEGWKEGLT